MREQGTKGNENHWQPETHTPQEDRVNKEYMNLSVRSEAVAIRFFLGVSALP